MAYDILKVTKKQGLSLALSLSVSLCLSLSLFLSLSLYFENPDTLKHSYA